VLLVDDEERVCRLVGRGLERRGCDVVIAVGGPAGKAALRERAFDVVISDLRMPEIDGWQLLEFTRRLSSTPRFIMITGALSAENAYEALKQGADDYLVKPIDTKRLSERIRQLLSDSSSTPITEARPVERKPSDTTIPVVGESGWIQQLLPQLAMIAASDRPVLLIGEEGTGKRRLAHHIWRHSARGVGPRLSVSARDIDPEQLESQLFGHVRGAYAGAVTEEHGKYRECDGGVLTIEHVELVPLKLQTRLEHAIMTGQVFPMGAQSAERADVRLIGCCRARLEPLVDRGRLLRRFVRALAAHEIQIPPLRARREDIPGLALHFARSQAKRAGDEPVQFTDGALEALVAHDWPGNVAELELVVRWMHGGERRAVDADAVRRALG